MEGTSTLADALLDDLDDLSDVENEQSSEDAAYRSPPDEATEKATVFLDTNGVEENFVHSKTLQNHLLAIRSSPSATTKEEREREHEMIVQSNKLLSRLSDELVVAHGNLRSAYAPKFPELEDILPNPIQYTKAVRVIGNETDIAKVNDALNDFLNSNQIITLSIAGSTTSGRPLNETELDTLFSIADSVEEILSIQEEITKFVEGRMEGLAPSISALIGPSLAARMIGLAGGLKPFSKIPACNLQVLGQHVRTSAIQSTRVLSNIKHHQGILAECDLVKRCPIALQKKALKAVAAKLALVARCDFVNVDAGRSRNASAGHSFRHELEQKFEKWQEPDKAQTLKALPKPDLTTKKRRGGKRMRRLKERYEETALMKQANTRAFSAQAGEYGDDAMGLTMGLLGTSGEYGVHPGARNGVGES
ncbi:U4/U6 small nuclear ribonucleoprotein PRP31 [Fistulifera solaris]|uniref:U4/U6 small nuclear ribonucleoprotein PRP31 n=1 Tax=Fistulifera solaris TaxID=1519565 RepID=A0A1Z5K404_FISSO|nr:U4/U6 small nuclear ribonucleoprotein PRP31 [Fistulifera solaris]|eukprot:GAX20983.1 U4/U6 small nuclear ribonucleoprotein PRP31 [Fistulifera solaris]